MKLSFLPKPPTNKVEEFIKYIHANPGCKWSQHIRIENNPIQYLEIGVHKGENIVDVAKSYCKHPNSRMYCVDPWIDYEEYPEYKGQQDILFGIFKNSIKLHENKCILHRGFSDDIVPTFSNNFFYIVFVDGNHETEFVYRDGKMSFEKVKSGGYIIFDDYSSDWPQTMIGINKFLNEYSEKIKIHALPTRQFYQVIIQKL
jgi:hypothetical protein